MQDSTSHAPAQGGELAPVKISKNRAAYRLEMKKPEVKWRMFQERCQREQRERERLQRKPEIRKEPSKVVQTVLKRLRYMTDQHVKRQGGRASSILHGVFCHWDQNNSGMLNTQNLMRALSQVCVPISREEAEEVIAHYSDIDPSDGAPRELPHNELLRDATVGAPGLLEVDPTVTKRLLGSSRSERCLLGTSKPQREATYVVRAFRNKLQQVIDARVRDAGGSPSRILLSLFRNWDLEHSGTLNTAQLRGALRSFNMRLSTDQAKALMRFYAPDGYQDDPEGGCDYVALVQDVCGYDLGPFVHRVEQAALTARQYDSGRDSESSGASLQFTARPHEKPSNRVVERFKLRLRDSLEKRIKQKGGVTHAIIREAFLNWDADASGKLDPEELVGALKHMGVHITDSEAKAAVNYYDLDGSGAMSYDVRYTHELLCREIKAMSHPVLSYIEEVDVLNGLGHTVREPPGVRHALDTIRRGVSAMGHRAQGTGSSVSLISPENLLAGTCLRYDTSDRGALGAEELRQVWKQLKIRLRMSETAALVAWLDRSDTKTVQHSDLCSAVFGGDNNSGNNSSPSKVAPKSGLFSPQQKETSRLLPPPPAPHILQARRALAMSLGDSCSSITASGRKKLCPSLPGQNKKDSLKRQQRGGGGSGEKKELCVPYFENKAAWNWQGHALPKNGIRREGGNYKLGDAYSGGGGGRDGGGGSCVDGGVRAVHEVSRVNRRCGSAGVGSGDRMKGGAVLQASGEAIVAEKARIEKRLKELNKERATVLRRKKKWVECWADNRAGSRNSARAS